MMWVYDKRPCNGANFVYFGTQPVPSDSEVAKVLVEYTRGVLDALGIRNGPSHGEVMMTPDGPCLVEMNCRTHGGDGTFVPLARALTGGYSQVDAAADAFLDHEAFNRLPDVPTSPFRVSGQEVCLVCMRGGTVSSMSGLDQLRKLRSFVSLDTGVAVGSEVSASVDLFSSAGSLILMHQDRGVFEEDLRTVRRMETECALFELKDGSPSASAVDESPVVDAPSSTDAEEAEAPCGAAVERAKLRHRSCSEEVEHAVITEAPLLAAAA
uniref:ATP-grasp domain-containing protein n=1 Tax=Alexandrium monilatum TaxID=311494 RepID=A0A7S4SRV4_9DINO